MLARALAIGAALLLWPVCALSTLPAPSSDVLPSGFVRDHELPDNPAEVKRFFGYDNGEWSRGEEYLTIVVRNVERSLLADRDLRVRVQASHDEPVTSVRAGYVCKGRTNAWILAGSLPHIAKSSVTVLAHIGGMAYLLGYVYPADHPSVDATTFLENFCGYSADERKRIEPRLTNQPQ